MNRAALKRNARQQVRENYFPWLLVAIITIIISFLQSYSSKEYGIDKTQIRVRSIHLIELFAAVPLSRLALDLTRGTYRSAKESLFHNEQWLRDFAGMFLVTLYTFFWTLLFIIPGVVKAYSYSFVPYILAEDESISITDAIAESQRMTDGYKWDLFVLDLSFILWDIAAAFTFGLVGFYSVPYQKATWAQWYQSLAH
ncbi:DUF975 family protein [Jeotgalibaca caeni]|uniref:DUF975 family protein n=1 Tax=Jeotgalibaca caeni TaxID=3028623 RepID=UPI00237E6674|nr:DUF975 family protein [Jeotgalibaca caeni]MDE1549563.1 DUF975 family protein [Jeotgalibaca caeni]